MLEADKGDPQAAGGHAFVDPAAFHVLRDGRTATSAVGSAGRGDRSFDRLWQLRSD